MAGLPRPRLLFAEGPVSPPRPRPGKPCRPGSGAARRSAEPKVLQAWSNHVTQGGAAVAEATFAWQSTRTEAFRDSRSPVLDGNTREESGDTNL